MAEIMVVAIICYGRLWLWYLLLPSYSCPLAWSYLSTYLPLSLTYLGVGTFTYSLSLEVVLAEATGSCGKVEVLENIAVLCTCEIRT